MMDMSLSGHKPRDDDDHLNHLEDPPMSGSGHRPTIVEDNLNYFGDDPPSIALQTGGPLPTATSREGSHAARNGCG